MIHPIKKILSGVVQFNILLTDALSRDPIDCEDFPYADWPISLSESGNSSRTMMNSISSDSLDGAIDSAMDECTGLDYNGNASKHS